MLRLRSRQQEPVLLACLPFIKMVSRMPRFKLTCHYAPTKRRDLPIVPALLVAACAEPVAYQAWKHITP